VPVLEHVILVGGDGPGGVVEGTVAYDDLMSAAAPSFTIPPTAPEDMALLHSTSGTTGTPERAIHVHDAVVAHHATGTSALGHAPTNSVASRRRPGSAAVTRLRAPAATRSSSSPGASGPP
jgi:acetyl-CoA synthetase